MSGITAIGSTFNEPNYHGELIALTPTDTPLLSAAGGLNGGGQVTDTTIEWQTYDLRDPEIKPGKEGDDAPTAQGRVRANVTNRVQIFHKTVGTTYTKQAAINQYATTHSGSGANPVTDEHAWQIEQELKQLARDVNFSFWHARRHDPADNTEARQMAGLLSVIQTSRIATGEVTGLTSGAANIINETGTAVANGDKVVFTVPPAELRPDRAYFVVSKATDSFKVAATAGGAALTVATGQTGIAYVPAKTALTWDSLGGLMQSVYDNGGISEQETATLYVPSRQKRALTSAYAAEFGKADPFAGTRNMAGLNVQTIETDFGTLNVVLERALPPDALVVVSAGELQPVFLNVPGKGVLFEEELAKTGATDKTQIYGEIGLKYGNELAHGVLRGLAA